MFIATVLANGHKLGSQIFGQVINRVGKIAD